MTRAIARPQVDCSVEGCTTTADRRGMCNKHYLRMKRTGSTTIEQKPPCSVDGCERDREAQTWCNMHYKRWVRHGTTGPAEKTERIVQDGCNVDGCAEPHRSLGWCDAHYTRWRRHGDPLGKGPLPLAEVIKLRRLVGVPIDGPTPEMRAQYARDEARS